MGDPDPGFSFWRVLDKLLCARYPGIKFEVIPVAMVAINSHVCRAIVHECARYDPDLFIMYMGNNEVVGPYGPGTVFSPILGNLPLIRLAIALRSTRIGQHFNKCSLFAFQFHSWKRVGRTRNVFKKSSQC